MQPILTLQGLSKSFGAVSIAHELNFQLSEGEAVGVLGPNGAGKSTLLAMIAGALAPDRGRILLSARDITGLRAAARCRLGLARTFQIPQPFAGMTVFENLLVAGVFATGASERTVQVLARDVLERCGLCAAANRLAGSLTLLDRKRLELARALVQRPRLLLLDEIAGGLTEHECTALLEIIRDIRRQGVSLIWIEHMVQALVSAVDRIVVLAGGRFIADDTPGAAIRHPRVLELYMGIPADGTAGH